MFCICGVHIETTYAFSSDMLVIKEGNSVVKIEATNWIVMSGERHDALNCVT